MSLSLSTGSSLVTAGKKLEKISTVQIFPGQIMIAGVGLLILTLGNVFGKGFIGNLLIEKNEALPGIFLIFIYLMLLSSHPSFLSSLWLVAVTKTTNH